LWFSTILLLLSFRLHAGPVLRHNPGQDSELLGPLMEVYRGAPADAASILEMPEADWFPSTKMVPSFGMDDTGQKSYWVRFRLENPTSEATVVYLANHYPTTDHLRLYEEGRDHHLTLVEEQGDQVAYQQRSVRHRFPVFRLTLKPGVQTYYMEQQSFASIQYPLKLWRPDAFSTFATHENLMLGGIIGMCIFALIYNFFIFLRLKVDVYFLYMLHNASICIFLANFLGFTQSVLLPDTAQSWWLNTGAKVNMDIVHITAISFTLVFLDMKKNAPRWRRYFLMLMAFALLTLINTLTIRWRFNTQTALFSVVTSISLLLASLSLWKKFTYARYYTIGWSFLLSLNVVTMLSLLGVLPTDITWISWSQSLGHCFELCLLSLALGERMAWINRMREETLLELTRAKSNLVNEREQHIRDLDRKVAERTRDLQSILNNLQQGIFAIRWDAGRCLMDPDYSPYLHSVLGRFESQTVDPLTLLFQHSHLGQDDQKRIRSILLSMADGHRIGFDLNSASLPREILRRLPDQPEQILEIDWDPMVDDDGSIQKILVAVRDVSEYRALRSQLMHQTEDLMIARDLLHESSSAPVSRIAHIASELKELAHHSGSEASPILRRLHSLKGDSRTLMLKALSEAIHEAETVWLSDRKASERSLHALKHAARLAQRYHEICAVFERRFRRADAWEQPSAVSARPLQLAALLDLDQLPTLAQELGKPMPELEGADHELHVTAEQAEALRECFGHILRNALDHGIEAADERALGGKPLQGRLILNAWEHHGQQVITIRDDGRGLDLLRLREKAQTLGIDPCWDDDEAAAQLIFTPELSTRDKVSLISGRGLGLDAVHHRILALGGSLRIELLQAPAIQGHRPFVLHITLPISERKAS
jgi:signal transduction histidine kinase